MHTFIINLLHTYLLNYISIYTYKYEYNFNSISKNTKCILTNLYKDYIANDKEKELINSILNLNWQKKEYEKRKLYNPNSIFS